MDFEALLENTLSRTQDNWGISTVQDYREFDPVPRPENPSIDVTQEKTQDAVLRFRGSRVTALNFASAVNPGGGVRWGVYHTQEENVCLCSGLLHALESQLEYYDDNRRYAAPEEGWDKILLAKNVPMVRDGSFADVEPMLFNVITYAAPIRRVHGAEESLEILKRRAAHIVHCAVEIETEVLVLGAWGCGEYGNDPEDVARVFTEAVGEYGAGIKTVVHPVYGNPQNYETFRKVCSTASR